MALNYRTALECVPNFRMKVPNLPYTMQDALPVPVLIWNLQQQTPRLVYANQKCRELFPDESSVDDLSEFLLFNLPFEVIAAFRQGGFSASFPVRSDKGPSKWFRQHCALIDDQHCYCFWQAVVGPTGSSEGEHSGAQLSSMSLDIVLDEVSRTADIGWWDMDLQTGRFQWSDQMFAIFGLKSGLPLDNDQLLQMCVPRDQELLSKAMDDAIHRGLSWNLNLEVMTPSGEHRWVRSIGRADKDAKGGVVRLFGTSQDITETQILEQRLRRSEEIQNQAAWLGKLGGWELDLETGRLIWSSVLYQMHELPEGELISQETAISLYQPEAQQIMARVLKNIVSQGTPFDLELEKKTFTGKKLWVRTTGTAQIENGKTVRVYGMMQDISEQRRILEKLVQANQEAKAAAEAKSQFVATISHEIRTPMNGILGMVQLLQDEELTDQQKQWVQLIDHSGRALLDIINDVLDFSKIEAGKMDVQKEPISPKSLLAELRIIMDMQANEKEILLINETPDSLEGYYLLDQGKVRQILINLIANAIKFTEQGEVRFGVSAKNGLLHFFVKDTGIGISPEMQKRLFQPFSQESDISNRKYGGTGLGLSISHRLVNLMGGTIEMESKIGQGTCFWFELPSESVAQAPQKSLSEDVDNTDIQFPGHILVAEDSPVNQIVITRMLEKLGVEVTVVENGEECLTAMSEHTFDLLLLDCNMPVMDGFETVQNIRKEDRYQKFPVIALTANADDATRKKCFAFGMNDFVSKPYRRTELIKIFKQWLPKGEVA